MTRHNIEMAWQPSGEKAVYIKSHPFFGAQPYLTNQDCYFTVRVYDGGVTSKTLRMEVLDGQLAGTSYIALRENGVYTNKHYNSLTGLTYDKRVEAGKEVRDTVSVRFVSGATPSDLSKGFVIKVSEL